MNDEINTALSVLEATLINEESPDYIEISYQAGFAYILLAKREYKDVPLYERIMRIRSILEFHHEDILDKYPLVIECLSEEEFTLLLRKHVFTGDE